MKDSPATIWSGSSTSASRTQEIGQALARHLRAGDVVGLIGPLGAGKTQLVRGLAQGLDVSTVGVASPTFVLVHEYSPRQPGGPVLVHIDAYRLQSLDDLESIGWPVNSPAQLAELRRGTVVAVEWADRLAELLDADSLVIQLDHLGESERRLEILGGIAWLDRAEAMRSDLSKISGVTNVKEKPKSKCPICGKAADASGSFGVFCSARCQMVDLGRWLGGSYFISRDLNQRDLDED